MDTASVLEFAKTFGAPVAICLAIINRVSFVKALTSESNAVII